MTNIPEVKDFLANGSQPLKKKISTPIIIYQGSFDETVPRTVTDFLGNTAPAGTVITYKNDGLLSPVDKWNHTTVYTRNLDNFVTDVKTLMPIQ